MLRRNNYKGKEQGRGSYRNYKAAKLDGQELGKIIQEFERCL
jgi:hypothetical protein